MVVLTVSSKGQISIPKRVREEMNLAEGSKLTLEVRGQEIVLTKEPAWKQLAGRGAIPGRDLMAEFAKFRRDEREREDTRP